MQALREYCRWQFKLPKRTKGGQLALAAAFVSFVIFQTLFTVMIKATGNIFSSELALFDTQFMNIVYFGLCLPFWFASMAMRCEAVAKRVPAWCRDWTLVRRTWCGCFAEQGLILWTSALDAAAALLYGIGGNGAPADYQSIVSNAAPFVLQLAFYFIAVPRQRRARMEKMRASKRWAVAFTGGSLSLVIGVLIAVMTPGIEHTTAWCPYICFAVAAVATTLSWHVKEKLFVEYESNAVHINTWNAFHMVWMTFPMFEIQLLVPWAGCQTTGTIQQNFKYGWECMMNSLSPYQQVDLGLDYGCRSAAWTEWVYALATWVAGMAQFPLCQMTSSVVQFAATILTAVLSFLVFTIVPNNNTWVGMGEPFYAQVLIGVVVVALGSLPFYAAERDLQDDAADKEAVTGDKPISEWAGLIKSDCSDEDGLNASLLDDGSNDDPPRGAYSAV